MSDAALAQESWNEYIDDTQDVPDDVKHLRWKSFRRRKGKFKITEEQLLADPDSVQGLFADCIVTRCEHRWDADIFDYDALSWQFREVGQGGMAPDYVWEKIDDVWAAKEIEVTR